jgi:hypothetical protein
MAVVASDTEVEVPASETVIDLCIIEIEDPEVAEEIEEVEVISEVVIEEVVAALEEMDPDIWDSIEIDQITKEMGPEKRKLLISSSRSRL